MKHMKSVGNDLPLMPGGRQWNGRLGGCDGWAPMYNASVEPVSGIGF